MTCLETLTSMSSRSAGLCVAGSTRLEGWMEDDEDDVEEAGEMWNMVGRGVVEWMSWEGLYKGNRVGKRADDCVQCDRRSDLARIVSRLSLSARPPRRPSAHSSLRLTQSLPARGCARSSSGVC